MAAVVSVDGVEDCISVMQKIEEVLKRGTCDVVCVKLVPELRLVQVSPLPVAAAILLTNSACAKSTLRHYIYRGCRSI